LVPSLEGRQQMLNSFTMLRHFNTFESFKLVQLKIFWCEISQLFVESKGNDGKEPQNRSCMPLNFHPEPHSKDEPILVSLACIIIRFVVVARCLAKHLINRFFPCASYSSPATTPHQKQRNISLTGRALQRGSGKFNELPVGRLSRESINELRKPTAACRWKFITLEEELANSNDSSTQRTTPRWLDGMERCMDIGVVSRSCSLISKQR